jgi:hypothetical protein
MNSLFSILFKNILLLSIITVTLVFMFTQYIGFTEIRYVFGIMGVLYVLAACLEAYTLSQIKTDTKKFIYFTDGFVAKRIIKMIALTSVGIILYYSQSIIKYMAFLCFLIAFTELIVTVWRYAKNLCFVAFENNTLILSTNKINTTTAKELQKVEYRHGLMYFVKHNKKTITLRTDLMKEQDEFKNTLESWLTHNHITDKVIRN